MRTTNGPAHHKRRNKALKRAKGFWGGRSRLYRTAMESVLRAEAAAFHGRKRRKRDMRRLWITRLNVAARARGLSYSRMVAGLRKAGVEANRKMLSEVAVRDPRGFDRFIELAKANL